jgi:type VI protein secretion system component VasK
MKGYLTGLNGVAGKLQAVVTTPDADRKPLVEAARSAVLEAQQQIAPIAAPLDRVEWETLRLQLLLTQPLNQALTLLGSEGRRLDAAAGAGAAGKEATDFCQTTFIPITTKRPFVNSGSDLTSDDFSNIFGPNGQLRTMARAVREAGVTPEANRFLQQLEGLSNAFYAGSSNEPVLRFEIAPDSSTRMVKITVGGRTQTWAPGQSDLRQFTWNINTDSDMSVQVGDANEETFNGNWAIKNFFALARNWTPADGGYRFADQTRGMPFRARMPAAAANLFRGALALSCPAKWTTRE